MALLNSARNNLFHFFILHPPFFSFPFLFTCLSRHFPRSVPCSFITVHKVTPIFFRWRRCEHRVAVYVGTWNVRFLWTRLENYLIYTQITRKHPTAFQNGGHYVACFIVCGSTWADAGHVNDMVTRGFSCRSADPPYWHVVLGPIGTVI